MGCLLEDGTSYILYGYRNKYYADTTVKKYKLILVSTVLYLTV